MSQMQSLHSLSLAKIVEVLPIPLSQGEWEKKKYMNECSKLGIPPHLAEIVIAFLFGQKRAENDFASKK